MKRTTTALIASLTLFACADTSSVRDNAPLEALLAAHQEAWNTHDVDRTMALFADDATLVTPMGTRAVGAAAIRDVMAAPSPTKQTTSVMELEAVQWLSDDLVVIDAKQTLAGPGVAVLGASEAKLVAVARRVDDSWKLVAARPHATGGAK